MEYKARCHCGRVRFSFRSPEIKTGKRCNCSLCIRRGAVLSWTWIPAADFTPHHDLRDLGVYLWNEKVLSNFRLHEARRIAGGRAGRTGYQGGSQGGWVAPLAATRAPVDFVIVSFGLAVSVIEEDQEEVALEMSLKGHGPAEIAKALEVADCAEAVIESGFTKGFERFDAVRAKYHSEPWYKDVHGNYTYLFLPYNEAE